MTPNFREIMVRLAKKSKNRNFEKLLKRLERIDAENPRPQLRPHSALVKNFKNCENRKFEKAENRAPTGVEWWSYSKKMKIEFLKRLGTVF